jgi:single-stranded DNA-binding protein
LARPETKTSQRGQPYVIVSLKIADGSGAGFVRATGFSESVREELADLRAGDSVSITGPLEVDIYRPPGGEARPSLSMIADRALGLRKEKREREKARREEQKAAPGDQSSESRRAAPVAVGEGRMPDDDIPF